MSQFLTLSRAARLIGVRRGALQHKIRSGELATFEGMVAVADLMRAYPAATLEDSSGLERFEGIKDAAFARRVRERVLPGAEALMARLTELSRDLAQAQSRSEAYRAALEQACAKLQAMAAVSPSPSGELAELLAQLRHSLASAPHGEAAPDLLVHERFMRIMTAQVQIRPSGHEFFVDGNDSLLDAALRAGLALDYGCSAGSCGKCKARVVSGQVQRTRHSDYVLTAAEKSAGVVLMCCNTAAVDLVIEAREAHGAADMPLQTIDARVKSVSAIPEEMRLVHLQTPRSNRLRFLAGQSVTLSLPDGTAASLPVASCPCDDRNLHFHVQRKPGDAFAEQVFAGLKGVAALRIDGPRGEFVLNEASHRPLVFVAGGTGFAPIKSLIEHAMALETAESLSLYRIDPGAKGHYLDNLCRSWSDALDEFNYVPALLEGDWSGKDLERVLARSLNAHSGLEGCDVYVAGPEALVDTAQYYFLDRGLPSSQLMVDVQES